jgi:sugar/nucleoside kinase (ribokinase family)
VPVTECEGPCVDTVGAGDGYVAGFMYGYSKGKSLELCAQYGSTVSSFVIEKRGSTTNLPTLVQMLSRNSRRPDARNE